MNGVDAHIGARIRIRRLLLNQTTAAIANRIGVDQLTFAAFERGETRISARHLIQLCKILGMRPLDLFVGYPFGEGESEAVTSPSGETDSNALMPGKTPL